MLEKWLPWWFRNSKTYFKIQTTSNNSNPQRLHIQTAFLHPHRSAMELYHISTFTSIRIFFKFLRKLYLFPLCNRFKNKRHLAMKCTGFMGGGEGRFLGMQCFIAVVVLDIFENTLCAQSTTSYTQMCALFTRTHRFKHTHTYMNIISLCAHTCSKTLSNLNKHDDHARRLTHAQVYTIVNMYTRTHAHTNTYIHTKKHKYTHTNECRMRLTAAACHKEDV